MTMLTFTLILAVFALAVATVAVWFIVSMMRKHDVEIAAIERRSAEVLTNQLLWAAKIRETMLKGVTHGALRDPAKHWVKLPSDSEGMKEWMEMYDLVGDGATEPLDLKAVLREQRG